MKKTTATLCSCSCCIQTYKDRQIWKHFWNILKSYSFPGQLLKPITWMEEKHS